MKLNLLFFTGMLLLNVCFAQDTILFKNKLSDSVIEKYYVLKSNPEIKTGLYQAIFRRRTIVATGNYFNNKKTGIWQFFNKKGTLIEKFNYTEHKYTYEAPLNKSDDLTFLFDDTLKEGDLLTRPLKIGGSYYGFIPYVNLFQMPFDTFDINMDSFDAYIELLVSPLGRLAAYTVYISSDLYSYYHKFSLDVGLFNEEDKTFLPSTLNGRNILSRIIIRCYVTYNGKLEFY